MHQRACVLVWVLTSLPPLHRMEELGLHPDDGQVCFGQLLGMCDQISFPLGELGCPGRVQGRRRHTVLCMGTHGCVCVCAGQAGFPVYKYVPYGPVMEVLPYLSRRALENSSIMKGAQRERQLIWQELLRRLRTSNLFHHPA